MLFLKEIHVCSMDGAGVDEVLVLQAMSQFIAFQCILQSTFIPFQALRVGQLAEQKSVLSFQVVMLC